LPALLAIALLGSAAFGGTTGAASRGQEVSATRALTTPTHVLIRQRDRALRPVAASPGFLVWGSGGVESETLATKLVQRDLRSNLMRVLANSIRPDLGLASTSRWVVYAAGGDSPAVVAVSHDGSRRRVLGEGLIAPIASRGDRVAWAQEDNRDQRVFVRNMTTGQLWLAARLPRCIAGRCYRIDSVTLADRGVVFDRGAIGPQPSLIVRRAFTDQKPISVQIPNDPQPDLAPSSQGALYYAYARGWYRWDFGQRVPRLTRFKGAVQTPILRYERGDWYLRTGKSCKPSLVRIRPRGATTVVGSSTSASRLGRIPSSDCAEMTDLVLAGSNAITAWVFRPVYAITAHVDFGLVGVLLTTNSRS
jgi:hypothetical protein